MRWSDTWPLLRETGSSWLNDKAARLAAALAYYTVFSLAPLIVIILAIVGLAFGHRAAAGQIEAQIRHTVGAQAAQAVQDIVQNAGVHHKTGIAAAVLGVLALLLGAAGVFGQLKDALNTVWEVQPNPSRGLLATLKNEFLSLTMVLGVGFLLVVSLTLSAGIAAVAGEAGRLAPGLTWIGSVLDVLISLVVTTVLFALIFKVLPDVQIHWNDVWIGAGSTAVLFAVGKWLIGIYLGRSSVASAYGASGSLVVLLVWVYYSSQIMLLGAELTKVYA